LKRASARASVETEHKSVDKVTSLIETQVKTLGEKRLVESGGPKFSMDQANTGIPPIDNEWWKCYVMVVSPPRPSSDW